MRSKIPNVCSLVIFLLLAAIYFGVFGDLDWSWQIRTGQEIVQTGSLRTPDTFSYTIDGTMVHDFEWLYGSDALDRLESIRNRAGSNS